MTEQRDYRPASFRGVPFHVATDESEFGRRGEHHELPRRDKGYFEDLGQKDPGFTVDAYLVGPTYADQRDKLIKACNQAGLGELVHPYLGVKQVVCTALKVRHDKRQRRMVTLSITFLETGAEPQAVAQPMRGDRIFSAADAAQQSAIEDFSSSFDISGQPGFVSDELTADLSAGLDQVEGLGNLLMSGRSAVSAATSATDPRSAFLRALSSLRGTSLYEPLNLAGRAFTLYGSLSGLSGYGSTSYGTSRSLWSFGSGLSPVAATTSTRAVQASSQTALASLLERAAIIEAGRSIPDYSFDSYDQAVAVRSEFSDRIEAELTATQSDDVFRTLSSLRAAVSNDVRDRATSLARVSTITPATTLPALLVAYDAFEDLDQAEAIATRNRIRHPGFVPGGQPLEVLLDV